MNEPLEDKPSITEVLELAGGQLLGNGQGWSKAKCFAHDDRTPSGSLNEDLCKYQCFSCGFHGDSIDIIQAWKDVDFKEAIQVAKQLGVEFSGTDTDGSGGGDLRRATGRRSQGLPSRTGSFRPGGKGGAAWTRW